MITLTVHRHKRSLAVGVLSQSFKMGINSSHVFNRIKKYFQFFFFAKQIYWKKINIVLKRHLYAGKTKNNVKRGWRCVTKKVASLAMSARAAPTRHSKQYTSQRTRPIDCQNTQGILSYN